MKVNTGYSRQGVGSALHSAKSHKMIHVSHKPDYKSIHGERKLDLYDKKENAPQSDFLQRNTETVQRHRNFKNMRLDKGLFPAAEGCDCETHFGYFKPQGGQNSLKFIKNSLNLNL